MIATSTPRSNETERYYNYAYLDEQTKRMIRRAILKALAIPGYQVPFGSREMPVPYGWGTGGIQLTAAIIGPDDVYKCIDQGADDTTNAVSIRQFFAKVADVATTEDTAEATIIQTRHRIPEQTLKAGQVLVFQVPQPEPLRGLEARETETRGIWPAVCLALRKRFSLWADRCDSRLSSDDRGAVPDVAFANSQIRQPQDGRQRGHSAVRCRS